MVSVLVPLIILATNGTQVRDSVEVTTSARIPNLVRGFSILASDTAVSLADEAEPNVPGVFAVGFDLYNPKDTNPFNANGNIYDRPQREVSLHWNGIEIANRLSPVDIRIDGSQAVGVKLENAIGGSFVTVLVGKTPVYDREFIPFVKPFDRKWQMVGLSEKMIARKGRKASADQSQRVNIFRDETNDAERHRFSREVLLPQNTDRVGRVLGTLTLGPTPKGIDAWDHLASLSLVDRSGHRFEVVRCITPYRKGWTWTLDITHLLPLLSGKRNFSWECETYGEGWNVSFDIDYVEGKLSPRPFAVLPLWQNTYEIGTKKPLPSPIRMEIPSHKSAGVYTTVTGHGMHPNTGNAAEFISLWRKLTVNGTTFENTLWKQDCYLNPCRPQSGTWKYDRAGWAPGSVVAPWTVDVTPWLRRDATLSYEIQPYENNSPVEGNPARQVIESVLVLSN